MILNYDQELQRYLGLLQVQLIQLSCRNSELAEALDTANKEIARLNELQATPSRTRKT